MRNRWLKRFLVLMAGVAGAAIPADAGLCCRPPPVSATMLWKKLEGQQIDYRWRPLSDTSQNLVRSVVTAEDAGICRHNGVEWAVLGEVITEAMEREGGPTRGGSTITQQVAKNLFLWPSRSYVRKGLEIPLALWIDLVWTKRRIVEVYVNTAEWAPGVYGAEAAAQHHFKKSAKALTRSQAASLAASLPNPVVRNAGRPGPKTRATARTIRRRVNSTVPYLDCLKLD
jgi:monofunctional biosynthetic peptidoglycan transglycosylase